MIKQKVTCDDVFERLTAGPFLSDMSGDEDVELHLQCCHECRKLAEAMRPAIGLIHESLSETARRDLPSFLGPRLRDGDKILLSVRSAIATRSSRLLDQEDRVRESLATKSKKQRSPNRLGAAAIALAAVLLIAISAGAMLLLTPKGIFSDGAATARTSNLNDGQDKLGLGQNHMSRSELIDFTRSTSCATAHELAQATAEGDAEFISIAALSALCCTKCHSTKERHLEEPFQLAVVVRACGQCHIN